MGSSWVLGAPGDAQSGWLPPLTLVRNLYICRATHSAGCRAANGRNFGSESRILGALGAHVGRLNFENSASSWSPVRRGGPIALPLLALLERLVDGSETNIDAAGQLAFVAHDALGGDHLPAMKTCAVDICQSIVANHIRCGISQQLEAKVRLPRRPPGARWNPCSLAAVASAYVVVLALDG
jgi:hypothetical protein